MIPLEIWQIYAYLTYLAYGDGATINIRQGNEGYARYLRYLTVHHTLSNTKPTSIHACMKCLFYLPYLGTKVRTDRAGEHIGPNVRENDA